MKKTHVGRGLLILLLVSVCVLGFVTSRKADATKSVQSVQLIEPAQSAESAKVQYIDPEDMQQGGYYMLWDHGSGVSVVQYDRTENGNIYSTYSMKPSQSLFATNTSCTIYDAGNISLAGLLDIAHLLRCILAGVFVP
jgi:hypothetical protein